MRRLLEFSRGERATGEGSKSMVFVDDDCPPENVDHVGIKFIFDPGSPIKRDQMVLRISADDFPAVLQSMIDANRKAFLEAVGQALLAYPEP